MKSVRFLLIAIISFFILTDGLEARYYDSKIGRFLSEDPIGFEGGDVNLYTYTGNNPVNYTDPYGLFIQGAIPYICVINPPVCIGMGIGIGIGIMYYNPPKVPPIPFALPTSYEEQQRKNREHCSMIYFRCIQENWRRGDWSCDACYKYCLAQGEWPFHHCPEDCK